MKRINWIKLIVINILFVVVIILPFLPGPPNKLVIGLSVLAQSAGFFGLLLVPLGITGIILDIRKGRAGNNNLNQRAAFIISIAATSIITAIYLLLIIEVFGNEGILVGFLSLVPGAFALKWAIAAITKLRESSARHFIFLPLCLITIPLTAFICRDVIMKPTSDYSRSVAIERSRMLIAAIEEHKNKVGHYPKSIRDLEAGYLKKIPSPSIMGILNFRYNNINDEYSISFSQWLQLGSLEEIVLYDKNNLKDNLPGELAKYNYSFDLCRVKGAYASHDTKHDYWRYYLCD